MFTSGLFIGMVHWIFICHLAIILNLNIVYVMHIIWVSLMVDFALF